MSDTKFAAGTLQALRAWAVPHEPRATQDIELSNSWATSSGYGEIVSGPLIDTDLIEFGSKGYIKPFNTEQVNPASYNLQIGPTAKIETAWGMIDLDLTEYDQDHPYMVRPGGWILTDVAETIRIPPDHEAQVILRSSAARRGWNHATAGLVDPGYRGVLTLELINHLFHHPLPLWPGQQLVQLRISRLARAPHRDYAATGRYCNAQTVEACKDPNI